MSKKDENYIRDYPILSIICISSCYIDFKILLGNCFARNFHNKLLILKIRQPFNG